MRFAAAILMYLAAGLGAFAQIIVDETDKKPEPDRRRPVWQSVLLTSQTVNAAIKDQVATVTVTSAFHNPNHWQVEGVYLLSLPANANVNQFSMQMGGKEMAAELLDSQKARQIYEGIVRRNQDPALLELVGYKTLQARVFPIPAHGDAMITVSYTHVLEADGGLVRFQAPFFGKATAPDKPLSRASMTVTIESRSPIKAVFSPTHAVDIARKDAHTARATFESTNYASASEFALYFAPSDGTLGASLLCFRDGADDGVFMLVLSPGFAAAQENVLPKDIVFVFDRSGSMAGDKIRQAREALIYCIEHLHEKDRFTVVDFATDVREFESSLVEASRENRVRAVKYASELKASGGTNISDAIAAALAKLEKKEGRIPMVLFATDGLPTVGDTNYDSIVKLTRELNRAGARLFVFGVGLDVNTFLLDTMSEQNRGVREYVQPQEDIQTRVAGLYDKVCSPVFGDITMTVDGVKLHDVYPKQIPDIFRGGQVVLMGRYGGSGKSKVTFKGVLAGKPTELSYELTFAERETASDYLPRLWAGRKVMFLLDQIRLTGRADKELVDEIVALGKRYGIVTPYTSFLIVEENADHLGRMKGAGEKLAQDARASGGADKKVSEEAQKVSRELEHAKSAPCEAPMLAMKDEAERRARAEGKKTIAIKYSGCKTFYLRDGVWTDSSYQDKDKDKVKTVAFGSDEYYKLAAEHPRYFAVGDNLLIVIGDAVYRIEKK